MLIKENFFVDENIVVIDDEIKKNFCLSIGLAIACGALIGLTCGASFGTLLIINHYKNPNLFYGAILGTIAFGAIIGAISGIIRYGINARQNSNPIDI